MKKLLLLLMLSISTTASAGLLLEPFIGVTSGDTDGTYKFDYTGTEIGARAAYSTLGFFGGLDFRMRNYDADKGDAIKDNGRLALVVGYEAPILVRAFATYGIMSAQKIGSTELETSSDITLGVGYTGLPFVAINFEIGNFQVDKADSANVDSKFNMYTLSVSLPFNL